jgi:four helix bundle protein
MIRASRSPCANIAEGYGRFHFQEYIQFCRQARGSLYELLDHLVVANECGYLEVCVTDRIIADIKKAIHILNGYIQYLKNRKETWKAEE